MPDDESAEGAAPLPTTLKANDRLSWELATESIVVRIRWFGIAMGYVLALSRNGLHNASAVCAFLALGAGYAALDTAFHRMGEVFLHRWPLFVSSMEAIFIALLCYNDVGVESPFRWYYLLSLICLAIRYRAAVAWTTSAAPPPESCGRLAVSLQPRHPEWSALPLTVMILAWATWATTALTSLLKKAEARLERANEALEEHGAELPEPPRCVQRSVAAAGLRRRRGHPPGKDGRLRSVGRRHRSRGGQSAGGASSLVQDAPEGASPDPYTVEKLALADRQLGRIQRTIRELVDFARPASPSPGRVRLDEVVDEVLAVAKYYHRTGDRDLSTEVPGDLPALAAPRDYLTQVVLNLVFTAIDATDRGGKIHVAISEAPGSVTVSVSRRRSRDRSRGSGEALPTLLHDETPRHRPRLVRQSADRRRARRVARFHVRTGMRDGLPGGPSGGGPHICRPPGGGLVTRQIAGQKTCRGRILVVDDEEVIAATLQEFLQGEGFEVATAGDAPSALQRIEQFEPDVALCDLQLPGADGAGIASTDCSGSALRRWP